MVRILALLLLLPLAAMAQDRPSTILVLDGSGSMWGQIDGVNKIVIAREAVEEILEDFPADQALGLTVYGHRTRGDCTDIETVIAPAPGTSSAIRDYVATLNPRGKTPMTDSVIAAAEALRSTEEAATVILVSDGIETCNPDPCAAARVLEETGVDFTAHVIGFDVSGEAEAVAQMQCIAEETGGLFLTADNAEELGAALTQVVQAAPEPVFGSVMLRAELADGTLLTDPVLWDLSAATGEVMAGDYPGNPVQFGGLDLGDYTASAYWTVMEMEGSATFTLLDGVEQTVVVVFEPPVEPAMVSFLATLPDGTVIGEGIVWRLTGTDETVERREAGFERGLSEGAWQVIAERESDGAVVTQGIIVGADSQVVTAVFPEILPEATLTAFPEAPLGATVPVGWDGPNERNDYIDVATLDGERVNFTWVRTGDPVQLQMPAETGQFVIRYIRDQGKEVLASLPVTVTPIEVSVTPPATAVAGSTVDVAWVGPDYRNDYIDVTTLDGERVNFSWTRSGNPVGLLMPVDAGTYVVRYVLDQGRTVMARAEIEVTPVSAALTAAETAIAGEPLAVGWDGPDYRNDYIDVATPDGERVNYAWTRSGNPLDVLMPTEPGDYVLRYVLDQGRTVIATRPVTVGEVSARLEAPDTAIAGDTIQVAWEGPDYRNDYIAVARPGEDGYVNYTWARAGNPLELKMPAEPGDYEIRYVLDQGRVVIATRPISVTEVTASLVGPETAAAGATIQVGWEGPDYPNDYIAVFPLDGGNYVNYSYTRRGNPVDLVMPVEPGDYEIRYILDQGRNVLAAIPISVGDVAVTLNAPETAVAGASVPVEWTGPDYANDYIGVSVPGEGGYVNYTYTRQGNPLELVMPVEAGTYELRYYIAQGSTVAATRVITVSEVKPTLTVPATALAGETVQIGWDGPDYVNDYIGVSVPGEGGYVNYTYTRQGNPLELVMPVEAGTYELRYYIAQGSTVAATRVITVSEVKPTLTVPATALAGETVQIGWDGPDYANDYIGVSVPGEGGYVNYTYTRQGNPLGLVMPVEPGTYEVRYYLGQGSTIVAREQIEVSALKVQLVAPPTGTAGGTLMVGWDGPDYANDYIGISRPGEQGYETYRYTRTGNPVEVTLPDAPGDYEVRYYLGQGNTVVATMPLTVE